MQVLPVYQGDSILLFFNDEKNCVMIDCGTRKSYSKGIIKNKINNLQSIDLLVLTHTDEDHIGGLLKYYEDKKRNNKNIIKEVWFNSGLLMSKELDLFSKQIHEIPILDSEDLNISIKQGATLEKKLKAEGIGGTRVIKANDIYNLDFCKITVVSPEIVDLKSFYECWEIESSNQLEISSANDYSLEISDLAKNKYQEKGTLVNKTSIALIIEASDKKLLLMGDAFPSTIEKNIRDLGYNEKNKLRLEIVKVSHHGSSYGMSPDLLNIIDCNKFIISTNGSNGLPSKECLARIAKHKDEKVLFYFNYKNETTENIFFEHEFRKYNFEVFFLSEENNYTIPLS